MICEACQRTFACKLSICPNCGNMREDALSDLSARDKNNVKKIFENR